jgi:hypothetical protein
MNSDKICCIHLYIIIPICFLIHYNGCSNEDIFIQNLRVTAPLSQPSLHFTDGDTTRRIHITASAGISQKTRMVGLIEKHTYVNRNGVMQIDTVFDGPNVNYVYHSSSNPLAYTGENLQWDFPSISYSLGFDCLLTEHFALDLGVDYGAVQRVEFWTENAGLGFYSFDEDIGFRADIGWRFSQTSYDLSYVILEYDSPVQLDNPTEASIRIGSVSGKNNTINFYYGATINTKRIDWPFNFFLRGSFDRKELIDHYLPSSHSFSSVNANNTVILFSLTPGISYQVGSAQRLNIGVQFIKNISLLNDEKQFYVVPVMQLDWSF